jgi:hypothetical protein
VEKKGLTNCGQCEELPCEIFYQCIDPTMTKEQHKILFKNGLRI